MFLETFTKRDEMERASRWILGLVMALLLLGMVMVYSARTVKAARLDGEPMAPLFNHAIKVGLGLAGMLLMMRIDYRALGRHYLKIFIAVTAVLVLVCDCRHESRNGRTAHPRKCPDAGIAKLFV